MDTTRFEAKKKSATGPDAQDLEKMIHRKLAKDVKEVRDSEKDERGARAPIEKYTGSHEMVEMVYVAKRKACKWKEVNAPVCGRGDTPKVLSQRAIIPTQGPVVQMLGRWFEDFDQAVESQ